jgi:hypothetical protein
LSNASTIACCPKGWRRNGSLRSAGVIEIAQPQNQAEYSTKLGFLAK